MKLTPIVAIIAIAGLEALALCQHINGAVLGIAFAAIAGLGGYEIREIVQRRRERRR